ncbi:MAG: transporter substrate-binding domain-containing protein [Catalinimonas sp.]
MRTLTLLLAALVILGGCRQKHIETVEELIASMTPEELMKMLEDVPEDQVERDLDDIRADGKLTAITTYSATNYFLYRGRTMGYEYELLSWLADDLDLELEVIVAEDQDALFDMLQNGEGDIVASGMTITRARKQRVDFTHHHTTTRQMLVQRKPDDWRKLATHRLERKLVRKQFQLVGESVHVRANSSYYNRLDHLSDEMGGDIDIVIVPGSLTTEQLIRQVAEGEIDYTVADEHIAKINAAYYPQLDAKTPVSFPQRVAWAVRKSSPELLAYVDAWIKQVRTTPDYHEIYRKYFTQAREFRERVDSEFYARNSGRISPYDSLIRHHADDLGWDWRLVASQIYQESRFREQARSWAGARGLMQMMPATARRYGVRNLSEPSQNIRGGIKYLSYLENFWEEIPDSTERVKFVLASYNAGEYHVRDAQHLTDKHGGDPDRWDDVSEYLLKLSQPQYYNDPVVKYGYCRGREPYDYVRHILGRYGRYVNFTEDFDYDQAEEDGRKMAQAGMGQ